MNRKTFKDRRSSNEKRNVNNLSFGFLRSPLSQVFPVAVEALPGIRTYDFQIWVHGD